ncbi:MAG TPA: hypothetical protein VF329_04220 [Gammaproteobacteria bacterium]
MPKKLDFAKDYRTRALVAYVESEGADAGHRITHSYTRSFRELRYVLLTENSNVRAVYRVRTDNSLRRLRRWPKKLNESIPKPKKKTKDDIVRDAAQRMMSKAFGNPEAADKLLDEWFLHVNALGCCEDHAHELASLSPREIKAGREAGYLDKPLSIDAIREYKARLGLDE